MKNFPIFLLASALLMTTLLSCKNDRDTSNDAAATEQPPTPDTVSKSNPSDSVELGIQEDYINTNRVIWQKPDMIIDLMGDLKNKTIADIGAGTGFFTLRLVPKAKKVIAIDIDQRFIDYLDSVKVLELPESLQARMETRLATPDNPNLKKEEVDIVVIVNTFMYIKNPQDYLTTLKEGLSKGGKVIIVDFKKKRSPLGPPSEIRMPIHVVEEALYATGYTNVIANDTSLDYQYIITAEK